MTPINSLRLFSIGAIATTCIFFASCGEKNTAEAEAGTETPEAEAVTEAPEAEVAKQDTPDSLTDELIVQFNNLGEAMLSATDKASAEEAANRLSTIAGEIEVIAAGLDKLETPSDEERARLDDKMTNATNAMGEKMGGSMQAIMSNQEVAQIIGPAMMAFGSRMKDLDPVFERFGKNREQAPPAPAPAPAPEAPAPAPEAPAPAPAPAAQ